MPVPDASEHVAERVRRHAVLSIVQRQERERGVEPSLEGQFALSIQLVGRWVGRGRRPFRRRRRRRCRRSRPERHVHRKGELARELHDADIGVVLAEVGQYEGIPVGGALSLLLHQRVPESLRHDASEVLELRRADPDKVHRRRSGGVHRQGRAPGRGRRRRRALERAGVGAWIDVHEALDVLLADVEKEGRLARARLVQGRRRDPCRPAVRVVWRLGPLDLQRQISVFDRLPPVRRPVVDLPSPLLDPVLLTGFVADGLERVVVRGVRPHQAGDRRQRRRSSEAEIVAGSVRAPRRCFEERGG